jgi:hypothetical protein
MPAREFILVLALGGIFMLSAGPFAEPQQPAPFTQPQQSAHPPKHSHAGDFLIKGTVFTPEGFAFPGVEVRVRRTGEKKFRWEDISNFRGEFALRVPQGVQYELVARMHGYQEQSRQMDATSGESEVNLALQMKSVAGGKGK